MSACAAHEKGATSVRAGGRYVRMLKSKFARSVVSFGGTTAGSWIADRVRTLNALLQNDTDDSTVNGEHWLLARLAHIDPVVVLDVGANQGDWTAAVCRILQSAHVHAFEPVPATYRRLEEALQGSRRATPHQIALSGAAGTLTMWNEGGDGRMSSATARPSSTSVEVSVAATTGDEFLREHHIDRVGLLKIDVEGHEMDVLRGFRQAISADTIDVIQFELTVWSAISGHRLLDFYELLGDGFAIGKLYPTSIRFREYDPHLEYEGQYRSNFVAVRRTGEASSLLRSSGS